MAFNIIKTGTPHHKAMKFSSMVLVLMTPVFLLTITPLMGEQHEFVLSKLKQPLYALIVAVTFTVGLLHFKSGVQVLIEDYVHGKMTKVWINLFIITCCRIILSNHL